MLPKLKLKPVGARLIIKHLREDSGKIVVPRMFKEQKWEPVLAEVITIGDGARLENGDIVPVAAKPGDRILVPGKTGYQWVEDGEEYTIINERDVIAIMEEESNGN